MRAAVVGVLLLTSTASSASAQDYSFDARRIALGGVRGTPNIASKLVESRRRYRSILIPVGLVRMLSNIRVFYPNREDFDFSRAVEFAESPFHWVFGRDEDLGPRQFFRDLVLAQLDPDLNTYRGDFDPSVLEEGLMSLTWGKTFMVRQDDRSFQGIYAGAGPYLAARAYAEFDAELVDVLDDSTDRYLQNASLGMGGGERDQLAAAITGGYRARFPVFASDGAGAGRNGMYVSANFHYLYGLRFDDINARLQLDTDTVGLVTPNPLAAPLVLDWDTGVGFNLTRNFGIDAAVYGTQTFLERDAHIGLAISLRFDKG